MTLFIKYLNYVRVSSRKFNITILTSKLNSRLFSTEVEVVPKKSVRVMMKKKKKEAINVPSWIMLTIPVAAFGLGCWQVQRLFWKESLIKELKKRTSLEPLELPKDLTELESMEYHPVKVKGKFDHSREILMGPRPEIKNELSYSKAGSLLSSTVPGYIVITPFTLSDRNLTILVNRGWVPVNSKNPKNREAGQVTGEVEIVGLLRKTEARAPFGVKNIPEKGIWVYRDLNKMAEMVGTAPVIIDAVKSSNVPGGPVGGQSMVRLPNDHLAYVFTWYGLSIATGFMWYLKYMKPRVK